MLVENKNLIKNLQAQATCRRIRSVIDVVFVRKTALQGQRPRIHCQAGYKVLDCLLFIPWHTAYVLLNTLPTKIIPTGSIFTSC